MGVAILPGIVLIRLAFQIATAAVPISGKKEIEWIPVLGVVGSVATVLFGFLSLYFYLKSRRNKQILFTYDTDQIQTRKHPDVTIWYREKQIRNMRRARVLLWNGGSEEVRWSDIPAEGRPAIEFGESVEILSVFELAKSCEEIKCKIGLDSTHRIGFSFGYLNPGDGVAVEVLYENARGVPDSLVFKGTVIGGQVKINHCSKERRVLHGHFLRFTARGVTVGICLLTVVLMAISWAKVSQSQMLLAFVAWVALLANQIWYENRLNKGTRLPKFGRDVFSGVQSSWSQANRKASSELPGSPSLPLSNEMPTSSDRTGVKS